ncbi:MAG: deoxyribodipyrimidine photo-lyase [Candidatus Lokiarchaeota archaeon]|nr:deoxyribodipyrimidine photo-lyase [Candidatus Lokiarchaeota archaeon]
MDDRRVRRLKDGTGGEGPVVYWMSRDQRSQDNWALLHAQDIAMQRGSHVRVVFVHDVNFPVATDRQHAFMLRGLVEVAKLLRLKGIPFDILEGSPVDRLPAFLERVDANCLVTDFSPLKIKDTWLAAILPGVNCPVDEVDAHNIVPCWIASHKQEFSARFFRPRIKRWLPEFLTEFPALAPQEGVDGIRAGRDAEEVLAAHLERMARQEVLWADPGEMAARRMLDGFIAGKLASYAEGKNDPVHDVTSNISPYLHFGQIAAQRVAIEVYKAKAAGAGREVFLEEFIVRRELSDNFCHYNKDYDSFRGFPAWARKTLDEHRDDPREHVYTVDDLEQARTHDPLWNAAQREMVAIGKMHGWLRMYWAKKILEWMPSPEAALAAAIYLNDKHELDGRDPNGYVGIAWSIGGLHDRAWGTRPVFGKIRYMSYNGARSKFDVNAYIDAR